MPIFDTIIFVIVRIIVIFIAIYIAYYFVNKIINPYILAPNCLTNTNSCTYLKLQKYKNSFLALVMPSEIWIWFNGATLYIFNESPGFCEGNYEPVDNIRIVQNNGVTQYQRGNYQCIIQLPQIATYYTNILKSEIQTIYIKADISNPNIISIFSQLIDKGIISVNNISAPIDINN
jgi:hypothetical protein